ncbi:MAG: DUF1275 domain-containing protein [Sphingobacteriales bacterium]|nr:DUF1275 domain-containing protein [Sphingobacteriales bacterium]
MFRHLGKSRTFIHNLKLASLLSLVAGIVNVSGLFAVHELTTNVTGHFAFFSDNMSKGNYKNAFFYLLFTISFLTGAFVSGLLVESISRKNQRLTNLIPIILEISLLSSIASLDVEIVNNYGVLIALCLLFAMGLQNALVTQISNAIVRTTHLTGLFTDLGIEIAQVFFYTAQDRLKKLKSSIKLRLVIIGSFFSGCLIGGYTFQFLQIKTLFIGVILLISGLTYDIVKFKIVTYKRNRPLKALK